MSVASEVRSAFWVRSASWAALSGRSTGVDAANSSGESTSTTTASFGDVEHEHAHQAEREQRADRPGEHLERRAECVRVRRN